MLRLPLLHLLSHLHRTESTFSSTSVNSIGVQMRRPCVDAMWRGHNLPCRVHYLYCMYTQLVMCLTWPSSMALFCSIQPTDTRSVAALTVTARIWSTQGDSTNELL